MEKKERLSLQTAGFCHFNKFQHAECCSGNLIRCIFSSSALCSTSHSFLLGTDVETTLASSRFPSGHTSAGSARGLNGSCRCHSFGLSATICHERAEESRVTVAAADIPSGGFGFLSVGDTNAHAVHRKIQLLGVHPRV